MMLLDKMRSDNAPRSTLAVGGTPKIQRHAGGVNRSRRCVPGLAVSRAGQTGDDELLAACGLILPAEPTDEEIDLRPGIRERQVIESVAGAASDPDQVAGIDEPVELGRVADVRVVVLTRDLVLKIQ